MTKSPKKKEDQKTQKEIKIFLYLLYLMLQKLSFFPL